MPGLDETTPVAAEPSALAAALTRAALLASLVVAGLLSVKEVLGAPFQDWNDVRLARAVAFVTGNGLYTRPGEGAILGNIWGPFFGFFFAPAAMMPTPTAGLSLGVAMAILVYLLPPFVLLRREGRSRGVTAAAAFAFFWLYTFHSSVLRRAAFGIHPDPVALGFGLAACALVYTTEQRRRPWLLLASAAAAILSLGAKQMMAPVSLAIATYLLAAQGVRTFVCYAASLIAAALGALAVLLVCVDLPAMWHNAVLVPAAQPWKWGGGVGALWHAFRELAPAWLPFLGIVVAYAAVDRRRSTRPLRPWLRDNGWLMIGWVALACLPASLVGRVKAASSLNHLSYTLYFAVIAALLTALRASRDHPRVLGVSSDQGLRVVLVGGALVLALGRASSLAAIPDLLRRYPENPEAKAYAFAKSHPRQVYLPSHPLITLLAEGTPYHSSVGIEDQELAGHPLDEQQFRAHLPPDLRFVLVRGASAEHALKFLPDYRKPLRLEELPGWTVLVREER